MVSIFRDISWSSKKDELCKKFGITAEDCETIAELDECGAATLSNGSLAEAWRGNNPHINDEDEYIVNVFITRPKASISEFAEAFYVYKESSIN